MKLQVPYNKTELKISLMSASVKLERYITLHGEDSLKNLMDGMIGGLDTPSAVNEDVAKLHGITITDLINSSNYATLKQEYLTGKMNLVRDKLKTNIGLDDSESWAVIMADALNI